MLRYVGELSWAEFNTETRRTECEIDIGLASGSMSVRNEDP